MAFAADELLLLLLLTEVLVILGMKFCNEFVDVATAGAVENNESTPPINPPHTTDVNPFVSVSVLSMVGEFKLEDKGVELAIQVLADDEPLRLNIIPGQQQKHINFIFFFVFN